MPKTGMNNLRQQVNLSNNDWGKTLNYLAFSVCLDECVQTKCIIKLRRLFAFNNWFH